MFHFVILGKDKKNSCIARPPQATLRSVSDFNGFYLLLSLNLRFEVNHIFGTSAPNSDPLMAAELQENIDPPIDNFVPGFSPVTEEDLATPTGVPMLDEITENQEDSAPNINEPVI